MKASGLQVEMRDSVYQPGVERRKILYNKSLPDRPRYKVWLYLDGPDLSYVRSVTYTLHPTFRDPVRTVSRSAANPQCALAIWTWGVFDIMALVEDKSGGRHTLTYRMRYDRDIKGGADYEEVELSR